MHPYDEMKTWVGFGPDDVRRLAELYPHAEPHLARMSDVFYDRILANSTASSVFEDRAQVERLKGTLQTWAKELLLGPHDAAYFEKRQRIGQRHVEVGLPVRYMFLAMCVYREELCNIAHAAFPAERAHEFCATISRAADLDLAIMTGTYVKGREVRQLEALQEVLVSHLPIGVVLLNAAGKIVAVTPAASTALAKPEVFGLHWREALPTALVNSLDFTRAVETALVGGDGGTVPRVDLELGGRSLQYRASVIPLDHPHARALVHLDDLTDSLAAESRARKAESLAQLGALSAAVAHELRNPLAGISGAIQVIARSMPADDRRKPVMDKVEQQVRRLDALVTDLLAFARPTEPDIGVVDLADLSRTVADLVHREYADSRISVEGSGRARGDANLIQQVLLNLVQNAVQAQDGAGLVVIHVQNGSFDVSDDGPGVPFADRETIFAPFYTTRAKGTGLGLAICRKLITAMGGTVSFGIPRLKGANFQVTLPT